ncbi:MAG: SUMF1/EgtB/PvdO family nonheme iron enzyme [Deltaproteobacteria bacterium]|nr:SUMF1/EgtB/PvdO family nonheme iron enzyme [Deltaproteobacteria bacterium]
MSTERRCNVCQAPLGAADVRCARCGSQVATLDVVLAETTPEPRGFDLPPMRLRPGTMVSVYRVEEVIGEGGMGVVYKAWDEVRSRAVALKCLHSNLAGDAGIRRRFVREARVMRAFSHPNVVAIHDLVEQDYLLAIVMEYVSGPTLARHLERWRGRMPLDEIGAVFRGVLEALDEAHRHGVVHRDIKPENILLEDRGGTLHPKVVDFGIAKVLEGTTYTMSGALLGTCRYMSPEQVRTPQLADFRSDIYSLGVTLYQLCTGKVPFDDGNHFAVMMAHVNEKPRRPSELRADMPPALEALVLDALAKDPRDRPQTCRVFLERFDAALSSVAPPSRMVSSIPLAPSLRESDGSEMLLVPAGPFAMGAARRSVFLDAFYLDRTPVTNAQFKAFLEVTRYQAADAGKARFLAHWRHGQFPRGQHDHPVVNVSWHDAQAYAAWAGKRLPSEAEWEKAARGTDGRNYPWGRAAPTASHANFGKARGGTTRVGAYPGGASPYGALDLAGNVWEWCDDADDPAFYDDGPPNNPRNVAAKSTALRVMRGGSWMYGARSLRTFARTSFEPHYRFAGGGFRCARTP